MEEWLNVNFLHAFDRSGINRTSDSLQEAGTMTDVPIEDADKHFRNPDLPPDDLPKEGGVPAEDEVIEVVHDSPGGLKKKIKTFGKGERHEDKWSRTPNATGEGAIHVQTFFSKLTQDSVTYMDQSINEWLDEHPDYEVKLISTTIGTFTGKTKEPHLICQVWV